MLTPVRAASVRDALGAATDAIAAAGVETARLDAEIMLAEATGSERARLAADPGAEVPPGAARSFAAMVRRRVAREPVAYIVGRKGFRHLDLRVDRRALVPRPETEILVEVAIELEPASLVEVGTGSGAVALAVAAEIPGVEVVATDTSAAALSLARENAERLGLADRVRFEGASLPPRGSCELVLANLPYVTEAEWRELAPEITRHEPRQAVVAGPTGLEAIEALLGQLATGGFAAEAVALEVGKGQAATVAELTRHAGFEPVEARRDLAGIERVVVGRR